MSAVRALLCAAMMLIGACSGEPSAPGTQSAGTDAIAHDDRQAALEQAAGTEANLGQQAEETAPTSARFQLGTHYQRLSPVQPTSSAVEQVEVAEIFWYGCPHCYEFEPHLERWRANLPGRISLVRIPAVWNPLARLHGRAFYAAEALGKLDETHEAFFTEIHERGNALDSEQALAELFARFGVDGETFSAAFDSFDVHSKLQRADQLTRRYRVESVPSIVINGKYTTNATMAGGYERLVALIGELAASEAGGADDP